MLIVLLTETAAAAFKPGSVQQHPALESLFQQAESYYQKRDFNKSIAVCSTIIANCTPQSEPELFVKTKNLIGSAYVYTRAFDKARFALEEALKAASDYLPGNHFLKGESYYHIGVLYDRMGHSREAIANHLSGLKIVEAYFGADHLKTSECLIGLGEVYLYSEMNYKKSNEYFKKALDIRERQLKQDHLDLYVVYYYLAQVNRRAGDFDNALTFAFKALSVINSRKDYSAYLERCYTLLGDIYYSLTNFDNAVQYLNRGIGESIKLEGPVNYNLIKKYLNLGVVYGEMNRHTEAINRFKRSLAIYDRHHHHNQQLKAENFLHLGRMFQKTGQLDSANHFLQQYLKAQLKDHGPKHGMTSEGYRYLARYFYETQRPDSAAKFIQKSLIAALPGFNDENVLMNPKFEIVRERNGLFQLFADKGAILLARFAAASHVSYLTSAFESFQLADTLMQLSRNSYQQEASKLFFTDHYHNIYENALKSAFLLFEMTKEDRYAEAAYMFMEKNKALLLSEALDKAEVFSRVGLPDSLRETEKKLNTALATYRSQLEGDMHHHAISQETQEQIQVKIFEISQKQERFLDTIARMYPSYFQTRYQQVPSLREVRSYVKKHDAAFAEYFWGKEDVFILLIGKEKILLERVSDSERLQKDVERYYELVRQLSWRENEKSFKAFVSTAGKIYDDLARPVLEQVDAQRLILVRDGPLLLIPFESLLVSDANSSSGDYRQLDYLLRHLALSYAHSAGLSLKATQSVPRSPEKPILGFSYSPGILTDGGATNQQFNELPGAAREVLAISQILPGKFLLGQEATEDNFKSLAGDYDILHLAVHGRSDPEKQFSGSLFFKPSPDGPEDGELHVYELYDLTLKARLAVLSACESGVGKIFRGEGVFSIARGFAYAGCPSTVMTLWPVSDIASAQIMGDFYTSLGQGRHIDAALRQAKLNYIENSDPHLAHPSYWAAYIPTGNMEPLMSAPMKWKIVLVILGLAFGLGMLMVYRKR